MIKCLFIVYYFVIIDYGITTDGKVVFVNASSCNLQYAPVNRPIVFDIPLPKGFKKNSH